MSYTITKRLLHLDVTPEQDFACRLLELWGWRFLIDYGYDNAVERASLLPITSAEDYA